MVQGAQTMNSGAADVTESSQQMQASNTHSDSSDDLPF